MITAPTWVEHRVTHATGACTCIRCGVVLGVDVPDGTPVYERSRMFYYSTVTGPTRPCKA